MSFEEKKSLNTRIRRPFSLDRLNLVRIFKFRYHKFQIELILCNEILTETNVINQKS